jgi:hypothetical protein
MGGDSTFHKRTLVFGNHPKPAIRSKKKERKRKIILAHALIECGSLAGIIIFSKQLLS